MALHLSTRTIETKTHAQTKRSSRFRRQLTPYLFLLPGILLLSIWVYLPLLQTGWLSLFHGNLVGGSSAFVGLSNYIAIMQLPEFQQALVNTGVYIVGVLVLAVLLPLCIAFLLARVNTLLRTLYQSILFTPAIMAPIAVSLIWLWIINPVQGVLTQLCAALLDWKHINWLNEPTSAIWVIVGITAWRMFGISLTLFLAALSGINGDYLDAARSDGASEWQITRLIVLPLLTPTLFFLVLYTILFAGQWSFGPINVLTQGGPGNATTNVYYLLYQFGFEFFNTGYASALAMLLFLVMGGGTMVGISLINRKAHYER